MAVVVYADMMSQPSRAVAWFAKLSHLPHSLNVLRLVKLEHRTEAYEKINPFKKVPAIDDNGFCIFESHTIMRYLVQKYNLADSWYPQDLQKRVRVDEYLDVRHHLNTRRSAGTMFLYFWAYPRLKRELPDEKTVLANKNELETVLDYLENFWLKGGRFIAGNDVSIADLSAYEEVAMLHLVRYDFSKRTRLVEWMRDMESLPYYAEIHEALNTNIAQL